MNRQDLLAIGIILHVLLNHVVRGVAWTLGVIAVLLGFRLLVLWNYGVTHGVIQIIDAYIFPFSVFTFIFLLVYEVGATVYFFYNIVSQ